RFATIFHIKERGHAAHASGDPRTLSRSLWRPTDDAVVDGVDRGAARHQAPACRALLARDIALTLPVCSQAPPPARRPDSQRETALDQGRRLPYLDGRRNCTIRGLSSDRHEAAARARIAALHRTAALRRDSYGPPAHPQRRVHDEAAKDRH